MYPWPGLGTTVQPYLADTLNHASIIQLRCQFDSLPASWILRFSDAPYQVGELGTKSVIRSHLQLPSPPSSPYLGCAHFSTPPGFHTQSSMLLPRASDTDCVYGTTKYSTDCQILTTLWRTVARDVFSMSFMNLNKGDPAVRRCSFPGTLLATPPFEFQLSKFKVRVKLKCIEME